MATWMRWIGMALFCALWGFAGTVGGVYLLADQLRGPVGPPGAEGPSGETTDLSADISNLQAVDREALSLVLEMNDDYLELEDRLTGLEGAEYTVTSFGCSPFGTPVVTAVRVSPFGDLDVDTERLCAVP